MGVSSFPVVSIVTPAYNAARFVAATIRSVQMQTYPHWEMLIVDDCSRDNTAQLVDEFAQQDKRIQLIRQRTNGGPAAARNAALEAAAGRYVAFLDSDDLWLPIKLERQLDFMSKVESKFCFTQFRRVSEHGDTEGEVVAIPHQLTYGDLLKNTAIATSTVLIDRAATGPFRMTKTYYDDYALWLELTKKGFIAHGLQDDLARYRVVGASVSRNKLRSAKWVWRTYRDIEKLSWPYAVWCFVNYAKHAYEKYRQF